MKAEVYVTLKRGVLDPQGKAIQHAIEANGSDAIAAVRQGKYFEIEVAPALEPAAARAELDRIAREILSNPVIEDYRLEIHE
ncbi:MAG: phosphoribosylformylglycinamidine synthase subunit PurS [Acidobacteria bacterium]|nr:phosphoribosylformylglycinamidine synthase subunit PurS [Acidobacteriota bacterium]